MTDLEKTKEEIMRDFWTKSFYSHEKSEEWVQECLDFQVKDLKSNYDKALATKVSWWFKYYVDPVLSLGSDNYYLTLQFGIVVSIAAVEAVLGGGGKPAWKPVFEFFEENLSDSDKKIIEKGIDWTDSRKNTMEISIRELVARRNALLHGLYLPNLNAKENLGTVTYSQFEYKDNKNHVGLIIKLTPEDFAEKTKIAIQNYFKKKI